ncbi:hypothetical protein [Phenylobacterium sp.]|jgi:hypothetical protein|uniref:hypothetical protein n=1 Tax=Phenylobacterium sp. TaxID=1871053 RepID=UPI002F9272D3
MTDTDAAGGWNGAATSQGASPKEMASSAAQTVKQEAATFAADAKDKASQHIEQHKETATRTLGDFADAIRRAGEELSNKDQSVASRLVQQAADGLESFSRSVSDKRPEEMIEAVRDFGRRNPTAFIAGSVLVGVALGRFLRSSGSQSMEATFSAPGGGPPAMPLAGDEFYSSEGADLAATGATSIGAPASDLDALGDEAGVSDLTEGDGADRSRFGGTGV